MIVKVLLAALAAGLVAGIFMVPLQAAKVTPLILQAEAYEFGEAKHEHGAAEMAVAPVENATKTAEMQGQMTPEAHTHGAEEVAAEDAPLFFGRFWNTLLANLVTGAGYGLLMAGISVAVGVNITFQTGILWGVLGWLCVQLLPALGLPPEVPGSPYVDLDGRQIWWVATIALSVIGFGLLLLSKPTPVKLVGLIALFAPHIYGAPQPEDLTSNVPAYLASQYAVAALATTLCFWLVLGLALGWFMDRSKLNA